jgi:hypothetical protein
MYLIGFVTITTQHGQFGNPKLHLSGKVAVLSSIANSNKC